MGVVSLVLTVILSIRQRNCSLYGVIALGLTVFMGLFMLDAAVVIRYLGITPHTFGYNLNLDFSSLFRKTRQVPETISNMAVLVPFGFLLAEFLAEASAKALSVASVRPLALTSATAFTAKMLPGSWRRLGWVVLAAFGLSLSIECLQLLLQVGFFELTDLVLNSVGGFVGASLSLLVRRFRRPQGNLNDKKRP